MKMGIRFVKFLTAVVLTFSSVGFLSQTAVYAETNSIGVSPAYIKNEELLPGTVYKQEVVFSRAQPDSAATAVLVVESADLAKWISFEGGKNELNLPQGVQRVNAKIQVSVPSDTKLGLYQSYAYISVKKTSENGQVTLVPAVRMDINLVVGNKAVFNPRVLTANVLDAYYNEPLSIRFSVENDGNSNLTGCSVNTKIFDLKEKLLGTQSELISEPILSFTRKEVIVSFDKLNFLDSGNYVAEVTFTCGAYVFQDKLPFNSLGLRPAVEETSKNANVGFVLTEEMSNLLKFAGVCLVTALILFVIKRRKKKDGENNSAQRPRVVVVEKKVEAKPAIVQVSAAKKTSPVNKKRPVVKKAPKTVSNTRSRKSK